MTTAEISASKIRSLFAGMIDVIFSCKVVGSGGRFSGMAGPSVCEKLLFPEQLCSVIHIAACHSLVWLLTRIRA